MKSEKFKRFVFLLIFVCNIGVWARWIEASAVVKEDEIINLESVDLKYEWKAIAREGMGKGGEAGKLEKIVKIRNMLKNVLSVKDARSTCSCLNAEVLPRDVKAGGVFEVKMILDTAQLVEGEDERVVYILTGTNGFELIRLIVDVKK